MKTCLAWFRIILSILPYKINLVEQPDLFLSLIDQVKLVLPMSSSENVRSTVPQRPICECKVKDSRVVRVVGMENVWYGDPLNSLDIILLLGTETDTGTIAQGVVSNCDVLGEI